MTLHLYLLKQKNTPEFRIVRALHEFEARSCAAAGFEESWLDPKQVTCEFLNPRGRVGVVASNN